MIHIDLFSGIGGFALAAKLAGWNFDNTFHSDIDSNANAIYAKNFPDSIGLGDITKIDGYAIRKRYPNDEIVITGGFPCQDISCAGKKRGINASRSGLWFEMLRLVKEIKPQVVIAENVRRLCTSGLSDVLRSLAEIGYDAEWEVKSAAEVGAPHLRERVWIIATPAADTNLHGCDDLTVNIEFPGMVKGLGNSEEVNRQDNGNRAWADWPTAASTGQVPASPRVRRVDDGISSKLDLRRVNARVRALGNAVVPQVAAEIYKKAARHLDRSADPQGERIV